MTRWVYLPCPANPVVFCVGVFGCGSGPFLCCFAVVAGETQIWPGDLRVVAVLPGFCLVLDLPRIVEPRCFIMFAIYLPASLIVRTEPQSEIGRNRGWAAVLTILHRWQKITAMEFISRGVKIYQWDWDEPRRWWPASPFFARCDAALNVWNEMENRYIFHLLEPGFGDREICLTNCNMCWLKVL